MIRKTLLFASIFILTVHIPIAAQAPPTLEYLEKKEEISGCCGFFYLAKDSGDHARQVFGYEGNNGPARIRVNGKLFFVNNTMFKFGVGNRKTKKGDKVLQVWKNKDIAITLDLRVTTIGEEGTDLVGKIKIDINGTHSEFDITGYIGC